MLGYFEPFSKSTPHIDLLWYNVTLLDQLFRAKLTGKSLLNEVSQFTIGLKNLQGLIPFYAIWLGIILQHFYLLKFIFTGVDLGQKYFPIQALLFLYLSPEVVRFRHTKVKWIIYLCRFRELIVRVDLSLSLWVFSEDGGFGERKLVGC